MMSWTNTLRTSAEDLSTLAENEPPTGYEPNDHFITEAYVENQQTNYGLCPPSQKRLSSRPKTAFSTTIMFQTSKCHLPAAPHRLMDTGWEQGHKQKMGVSHVATSQDRDERHARLAVLENVHAEMHNDLYVSQNRTHTTRLPSFHIVIDFSMNSVSSPLTVFERPCKGFVFGCVGRRR